MAAISLDGKIAYDDVRQIETSPEDKRYFERVTREAGTIITGRKTLDAMQRPLEGRRNIVYTKQEVLLATEPTGDLRYTDLPPAELLAELAAAGVETVAVIGGADIFTAFADHTDEWHLTVVPMWVGITGIHLAEHLGPSRVKSVDLLSETECLYVLDSTKEAE